MATAVNALSITSLFLELTALVWALSILRHSRDWRSGAVVAVLATMATFQALAGVLESDSRALLLGQTPAELGALAASLLGLCVVFTLQRARRQNREVDRSLDEDDGRYRRLVDSSPFGVVAFDRQGRPHTVNDRLLEILGSPSAKETMKIDLLTFPPLVESGVSDLVRRCVERGESGAHDTQYTSKWNRSRYLRFHVTPVHDGRGDLQGGQALVEDVTEARQVAESLAFRNDFERLISTLSAEFINRRPEQIQEAIGEALERVGRFMGADRVRVSQFNDELNQGQVVYMWSASGAALSSYPKDLRILTHDRFPWVFEQLRRGEAVVVPSVADLPEEAAVEQAFWKRIGVKAFLSVPLSYRDRLIGEFGFAMTNSTHDWSNEEVGLLGLVCQLLTNALLRVQEDREKVELESQLRQAQKMEAVGVLAGGIAHDFNNLLTGVLGGIEIALLDVPSGSESAGSLHEAQEAAERAAELTQQLLAFSRKTPTEMSAVDVGDVLARTVRLLRHSVPESIELGLVLDGAIPTIRGDTGQLDQALLNLGINARDAMPEGGRIEFRAAVVESDELTAKDGRRSPAGRYVAIAVKDSGCGMSPEVVERIFEPFFTTKEPGKGTGLGLAMVYGCARAHDGWVDVHSTQGSGTEFRLMLPLVEAEEVPESPPPQDIPRGAETLLLVDDVDAVLFVGRRMLERCGYRVIHAWNGEEALERYEENAAEISAVITDLAMPRSGGRDLLRSLRERGAEVPVVLTSGHAVVENPAELIEEGFTAVVSKPFDMVSLAKVVRRVLDENQAP